jgi:hypothetical protein
MPNVSVGRAGEALVVVSERQLQQRHRDAKMNQMPNFKHEQTDWEHEQTDREDELTDYKDKQTDCGLPKTRADFLMSDLPMLCCAGAKWSDLQRAGVSAEDLLFNDGWKNDLTAPVLFKLGLKWKNLTDAGLSVAMVVHVEKPLDWWVQNLGVDGLFFHVMKFQRSHLLSLGWNPANFRALLGNDMYMHADGVIELRPTIRTNF